MSAPIVDQPAPIPNERPATWDHVMVRTRNARNRIEGDAPAWDRLLVLMAERDRIGRQRYGVRLQPHNGRDALVDAIQESLDLCAYLGQWHQEHPDRLDAVQMLDHAIFMALRLVLILVRRDEGATSIAPVAS